MNRRQLVAGSAAALAAGALRPTRGLARAAAVDPKFLFVFAQGGWDTTRVFAPAFGNRAVDMEADAAPWSIGNLSLVDSPRRPSVRAFFDQNHRSAVVVNGLLVPSVAHETCAQMVMTGGTRGTPDWAALLAGLVSDRYVLPNLVVDCPSFPAQFGMAVARSGSSGQLDGLVDGSLLAGADAGVAVPSTSVQGIVDRYMIRRIAAASAAAAGTARAEALARYAEATNRAIDLKDARGATTFGASGGFSGKLSVAVEALASGLSRCVSIAYPDPYYSWDTHADNDAQQTVLWDDLFAGMIELVALLAQTPGTSGAPLADEVVVVVVSEMGRTPQLNGDNGKDHWPYTSALLFGGPVVGDQQIGGFDSGFSGETIDLASGELGAGVVPSASHVGATLLALGGHDPAEWVPGYDPLGSVVG